MIHSINGVYPIILSATMLISTAQGQTELTLDKIILPGSMNLPQDLGPTCAESPYVLLGKAWRTGTSDGGISFSPKGKKVGFATANNIFKLDKSSMGGKSNVTLVILDDFSYHEVPIVDTKSSIELSHGNVVTSHIMNILEDSNYKILNDAANKEKDSLLNNGYASIIYTNNFHKIELLMIDLYKYKKDFNNIVMDDSSINKISQIISNRKNVVINMSFYLIPCEVKSDFANFKASQSASLPPGSNITFSNYIDSALFINRDTFTKYYPIQNIIPKDKIDICEYQISYLRNIGITPDLISTLGSLDIKGNIYYNISPNYLKSLPKNVYVGPQSTITPNNISCNYNEIIQNQQVYSVNTLNKRPSPATTDFITPNANKYNFNKPMVATQIYKNEIARNPTIIFDKVNPVPINTFLSQKATSLLMSIKYDPIRKLLDSLPRSAIKVAASGNFGDKQRSSYPAVYDDVIAVGAAPWTAVQSTVPEAMMGNTSGNFGSLDWSNVGDVYSVGEWLQLTPGNYAKFCKVEVCVSKELFDVRGSDVLLKSIEKKYNNLFAYQGTSFSSPSVATYFAMRFDENKNCFKRSTATPTSEFLGFNFWKFANQQTTPLKKNHGVNFKGGDNGVLNSGC